jgi:hypothetical protein
VKLSVRTDPEGAEVFVNWQPKGSSPITLDGDERSGIVVASKDGYQPAFRALSGRENGAIDLKLARESGRGARRVLLAVDGRPPSGFAAQFTQGLREGGVTVLGAEETREFARESARAGLSNRALHAWVRARFEADLLLRATVATGTRDLGNRDPGNNLGTQLKGVKRTEVTISIVLLSLKSGSQLAAFSAKGGGFGLDDEQSLEKAVGEAVSEATKQLGAHLPA